MKATGYIQLLLRMVINENDTFDFYQEYMPWHYDIVLEGFEKNFEFLSGGGK